MNNGKLKLGFLAGVASLTLGVSNGHAQESVTRSATAQVDEIVVTAQKRAENIEDVPIAISAYLKEDLVKSGTEGMIGLQQLTPGLQIGTAGMEFHITMRGIGGELTFIGSESGVNVSLDGIPLVSQYIFDGDFADVGQVEALRGPQGTINGRNSTGGAINIYSNTPTDEFDGAFNVTMGNYNRVSTESYVNGPIIDGVLLGRLMVGTDNADGWLKNTFLNEDQLDKRRVHVRASFLSHLSESLDALLILDGVHDRSGPPNLLTLGRLRPDTPGLGEFAGVSEVDLNRLEFEGDSSTFGVKDQYRAGLKLTWDFSPSATLTSTTGYIVADINSQYDCDGTRVQACTVGPFDFDISQFSQELTLTYNPTDRLDLTFGGIYIAADQLQRTSFYSVYLGLPQGLLIWDALQGLDSYAIYGQLHYNFTERLALSVGGRYTKDEKTYREVAQGPLPVANPTTLTDSWSAFTPRVALDYALSDNVKLYASVSKGFKAGGFNTYQSPQVPFNPEVVWSYEVGAKAYFANRLRASVAAFFMDYTDLQNNVYGFCSGCFTPQIINAGSAEIKGLEMELDYSPTESLSLGFSGTLLDATYTELATADPVFPELGTLNPATGLNVRDLSGNQLPRAPKWQYSVSAEYSTPLSGNMIGTIRADYSVRDDQFFTLYNYPLEKQEAYGLLNLYAGIEADDARWSIGAFARNALDERYIQNRQPQSPGAAAPVGLNRATIGEPLMYGIKVSAKFN